jgi:hypothetical protein
MWKIHSEHEAQLRELRTCQNNTASSLTKLESAAERINQKLDTMLMRPTHGQEL